MTISPEACYRVLEIAPGASPDAIKQAYRDLARVWHPDRFLDDPRLQQKAEAKLKQINAAYTFLKTYRPSVQPSVLSRERSVVSPNHYEKLQQLLKLGQLKEADHETKLLLLKLAGRERENWLTSENIDSLTPQALAAIDQLWLTHSNHQLGFSVQRQLWHQLNCTSSSELTIQTISEIKFGKRIHWHTNGSWLSQWDNFSYNAPPQGSLPRDYIFALSGWHSYSKGWIGYLLWRFDAIFLKVKA